MATGGAEKVTVGEYDECPVCRDCLRDPRTLNCGHYFCRGCIQEIVRVNPQCSVNCPTCRAVTKLVEGSGVIDLPRHEGRYSLQNQVAEFLSRGSHQSVRYCDVCQEIGEKQTTAANFCYGCIVKLCKECGRDHEKQMPSHKYVPIADAMFCTTHVKELVVSYCEDCKKGICCLCAHNEHKDHQNTDIFDSAKQRKQRLMEFLDRQDIEQDNVTLKHIQAKLASARKLDTEFKGSVSDTRKLIKELGAKLDQAERDTNARLAAAIKTLTLYESDIEDIIASGQSLVDSALYLTEKASDPEVVEREREFPGTKVTGQNIDLGSVKMPMMSETFPTICGKLQQLILDCKVEFAKERGLEDLTKQHTVPVNVQYVGGITMDINRQRLVVRTSDTAGPIKMYTYTGQLKESLGAGVPGLADCINCRGICMDTKRSLYMAPSAKTLVMVDRAGQLSKAITVGSNNYGVAYHKEGDCYLVSDAGNNTIYLIDPDNSQVTRQIGSGESGTTQFSGPYHLHVGTVAGVDDTCILVSDYSNACIKVFDISGRHVKTYGSSGTGDRQFNAQRSVTSDPRGRVIVADQSNKRVTSHWVDPAGTEQWERVLHNDWGGSCPFHLALDTTHMVMAVCDTTFETLHIYN